MIRDMKKNEMIKALELLVDEMQSRLASAEMMWNEGADKSRIIGFLEGAMHAAQIKIQSIIEK